MSRRLLVAGNWKANGDKALLAEILPAVNALLDGRVDVAIFPPFPYLSQALASAAQGLLIGAQNVAAEAGGALTGEVSVAMLQDVGCASTLLGHSERRSLYGESDAVVAAKLQLCQQIGFPAVLCVGETLQQRESGSSEAVVKAQLAAALGKVRDWQKLVIAYEPVWAIGTGMTASPEQAQQMHAVIRAEVAKIDAAAAADLQILYGGSVNAGNAAELFAMPDIDGGLIGGASLKAEEFCACIRAAQAVS